MSAATDGMSLPLPEISFTKGALNEAILMRPPFPNIWFPTVQGVFPVTEPANHDHRKKRARRQIDLLLEQSGWIVQDRSQTNLAAGPGVAIREALLKGGGADYLPLSIPLYRFIKRVEASRNTSLHDRRPSSPL